MESKAVFDFDKTLIRVNSFPCWIIFVLTYSFLRFRFSAAKKVFSLLKERKISRSISHADFKKEILKLPLTGDYCRSFARLISLFRRKKVVARLKELYVNNLQIGISSAAPEIYLKETIRVIFPDIYENILVIGATVEGEKLSGNHKEEKVENLYRSGFLHQGETMDYLYSDSWDDSHLAFISKTIFLVSPTHKDLKLFKEHPELSGKINLF